MRQNEYYRWLVMLIVAMAAASLLKRPEELDEPVQLPSRTYTWQMVLPLNDPDPSLCALLFTNDGERLTRFTGEDIEVLWSAIDGCGDDMQRGPARFVSYVGEGIYRIGLPPEICNHTGQFLLTVVPRQANAVVQYFQVTVAVPVRIADES